MFAIVLAIVLHLVMIRMNNFLYVFNLRQGTILIAVHQIALSSFLLIILLVGISHVGAMLSMLRNDMEDDADRRGYDVAYGEHSYHDGDVISTNNQRRFAKAQHLASGSSYRGVWTCATPGMSQSCCDQGWQLVADHATYVTVMFLYTSTILTSIYLMCCISLLHGAVKYKREYVLPWIMAACIGIVLLIIVIIIGDGYPCIVNLFGGHSLYHFGCALIVLTYIYAICAVSSFALETGSGRCARATRTASDERGERLLLLDHAAHSSLLSAAQLNKLNSETRSHFV